MPLSTLFLIAIALIIVILLFALWAGGRVCCKYAQSMPAQSLLVDYPCKAFLKGDPYRFVWKGIQMGRLLINQQALLITGRGKISSFIYQIMGISSTVALEHLSVAKQGLNTLEMTYKDESGFVVKVCVIAVDCQKILQYIEHGKKDLRDAVSEAKVG